MRFQDRVEDLLGFALRRQVDLDGLLAHRVAQRREEVHLHRFQDPLAAGYAVCGPRIKPPGKAPVGSPFS